jgi:hypothetical protein
MNNQKSSQVKKTNIAKISNDAMKKIKAGEDVACIFLRTPSGKVICVCGKVTTA